MTPPIVARVRIWDPLVRVLHWALVGTFVAAWLTRHAPGGWHEWLGYTVLAIVLARIAWGLAGSHYARFRQFIRAPAPTLDYLKLTVSRHQPRYLGHNPLGGWMIVALLSMVLAICISGWLYTTDRFWGVAWVAVLHEQLTNFGIVLALLHVAGVLIGSIHDRENLVAAMIHGCKRPPSPGDIA